VLDCQEWAKRPLQQAEHGGRTEEAGVDVKGGLIGREGECGYRWYQSIPDTLYWYRPNPSDVVSFYIIHS